MIWLWTALALGAEPTAILPTVQAITWAQPFQVAQPITYAMRGDKPVVSDGWMLEVMVPAGAARVRAIQSPVVYVGPWPARRANLSDDGTCMALWVPGSLDLNTTPVYFGPPVLPEKVTPELAAELHAQAVAAGRIPNEVVAPEPAMSFRDEGQLMEALSRRCAQPSGTDPSAPDEARPNATGPDPLE